MPSSQHEQLVELLKTREAPERPTLEEMRAGFEALAGGFELPPRTAVHEVGVDGVPADWVQASGADPGRVVLYLHGGGYVIGSRNTHRSLAARLSQACGARVLVLDYRLAPEHPYPAAVDDAVAAYRWILAQGVLPAHVAIGGDSAGGGLAIATLMALRAKGLPLPACGVCLSPWIDLEGAGETARSAQIDDPMVTPEALDRMATAYAAGALREPLASPLHGDWGGLPPLLIQVGTRERLLDDARRAARLAREAGGEAVLEEQEGLIHVWQLFPDLPEAADAVTRIGGFLAERLR